MKRILAIAAIVTPLTANGETSSVPQNPHFYVGADTQATSVSLNAVNADGRFATVGLRAGVYLFKGIAIEAQTSTAVADDTIAGINTEMDASHAVFVRLQTPRKQGFIFDLGLGYASTNLTFTNPATQTSEDATEDGFAWSARVDYALTSHWRVAFDYTARNNSDVTDIDSYGLGVSYTF